MSKRKRKHSRMHRVPQRRPGSAPGSITVDPSASPTSIRVLAFGPDRLEERDLADVEALVQVRGNWPVTWIDVAGLADTDTIQRIGAILDLHPLAVEDVLHTHQRPKVDYYGESCFVVARMLSREEIGRGEQFSMFLGPGFVATFQERAGDCLNPIRERIRAGRPRIRGAGADYLAYSILDAIVDEHFPVLEHYGERLEQLEDAVMANPERDVIRRVLEVKHDLVSMRRAIWPLREAVNELLRDGGRLLTEETKVYLRDTYDHTIQLIELTETFRELGASLMDVYLSSVAQRTNEVMRVLTMISTIFIPLTFLAGIYGMNFDVQTSPWNMPELRWRYGYPLTLLAMALVGVGLLFWFRRLGWIGYRVSAPRE